MRMLEWSRTEGAARGPREGLQTKDNESRRWKGLSGRIGTHSKFSTLCNI